jgi:hypothetical protein
VLLAIDEDLRQQVEDPGDEPEHGTEELPPLP